jgi:hypothetical protein
LHLVLPAPSGELAQVQLVGLAGQAAVADEELPLTAIYEIGFLAAARLAIKRVRVNIHTAFASFLALNTSIRPIHHLWTRYKRAENGWNLPEHFSKIVRNSRPDRYNYNDHDNHHTWGYQWERVPRHRLTSSLVTVAPFHVGGGGGVPGLSKTEP